jgi:hypothetical protein
MTDTRKIIEREKEIEAAAAYLNPPPAPRLPTEKEKMLLTCYLTDMGEQDDVAREIVDSARIAVIIDYMSDGPGYYGKIMLVVWPGGPELFDAFTFYTDGTTREDIRPLVQDAGSRDAAINFEG